MNKTYTSIFIFFVFAISCTIDKGALQPKPLVDCNSVTYSGSIAAIINAKCATSGCHVPAGSGNGDFTSYAGLFAKVTSGSVNNRLFVTQDMPPNASPDLTAAELATIRCWLDAGAPNN